MDGVDHLQAATGGKLLVELHFLAIWTMHRNSRHFASKFMRTERMIQGVHEELGRLRIEEGHRIEHWWTRKFKPWSNDRLCSGHFGPTQFSNQRARSHPAVIKVLVLEEPITWVKRTFEAVQASVQRPHDLLHGLKLSSSSSHQSCINEFRGVTVKAEMSQHIHHAPLLGSEGIADLNLTRCCFRFPKM